MPSQRGGGRIGNGVVLDRSAGTVVGGVEYPREDLRGAPAGAKTLPLDGEVVAAERDDVGRSVDRSVVGTVDQDVAADLRSVVLEHGNIDVGAAIPVGIALQRRPRHRKPVLERDDCRLVEVRHGTERAVLVELVVDARGADRELADREFMAMVVDNVGVDRVVEAITALPENGVAAAV